MVDRFTAILLLLPLLALVTGRAAAQEKPLTLAEAVASATSSSENALMLRERVARAENARIRARAAFLPLIKANGTFTHSDKEIGVSDRVIQRQNAFAGTGSVIVTLFHGPAIPKAGQAKLAAMSERSRAAWEQNLLAHEVAEAYFSVLASENLVQAAERTLATARELLAAVKARRAAGEALGLDETRAEFERVSAEEGLVRAESARDAAEDYLALLIDKRPPLTLVPYEVHPMPAENRGDLTEMALQQRPDLNAAARDIEAADKGVQAAWMDFLPSLSVSGNYRLSQNTGWSGDPDSWNIVVSLDWILYDGGLRRAEKRDRDSLRTVARLKERLLKREIRHDVRQAARDLKTADVTLKTAREKLRLAASHQDAVRARYHAGLATSLEVVAADDDLKQSELGAVVEALNLSLRRLALLRSLGLDPTGKEVHPL
jgi:outer membrane protein TolC